LIVPPLRNPDGRYRSWWRLPVWKEIKRYAQGLDPFGFILYDGQIAAQDFDRGVINGQPPNSWITHFTASSWLPPEGLAPAAVGRFTLELTDAGRQEILQFAPVNGQNRLGTATFPYYLKHPFPLAPNSQLFSKIINLSPALNTIQIVGWGWRP